MPFDPSKKVRVIGDEVLAAAGSLFPLEPTPAEIEKLKLQIEIARDLLIATGGAGIAANQCAGIEDPYRFAIVSVYWGNAAHKANVSRRYPGAKFPEAILMVNPEVISASVEVQTFRHGCLSVPGGCRGDIQTPKTITVRYYGLSEEDQLLQQEQTMSELEAVVLQHELNHILLGDTYIDCCLHAFDQGELEEFMAILKMIENSDMAAKLDDKFYHIVKQLDDGGAPKLLPAVLEAVLRQAMTPETKAGLLARAEHELARRKEASPLSAAIFKK